MGQDIGILIEQQDVAGSWQLVGEIAYDRGDELFAILRNRGTEGGSVPVALLRGIPHDLSDGIAARYDPIAKAYSGLGLDGCYSYLTVQELLTYDWEQCVPQYVYNPSADTVEDRSYRQPCPASEAAPVFYQEVLPALMRLGDPSRTRIVYGFTY